MKHKSFTNQKLVTLACATVLTTSAYAQTPLAILGETANAQYLKKYEAALAIDRTTTEMVSNFEQYAYINSEGLFRLRPDAPAMDTFSDEVTALYFSSIAKWDPLIKAGQAVFNDDFSVTMLGSDPFGQKMPSSYSDPRLLASIAPELSLAGASPAFGGNWSSYAWWGFRIGMSDSRTHKVRYLAKRFGTWTAYRWLNSLGWGGQAIYAVAWLCKIYNAYLGYVDWRGGHRGVVYSATWPAPYAGWVKVNY